MHLLLVILHQHLPHPHHVKTIGILRNAKGAKEDATEKGSREIVQKLVDIAKQLAKQLEFEI